MFTRERRKLAEVEEERIERIDLRVPEYVKARIRVAARLTGRSTTDFVIAAALAEAEEVTESVERWKLTEKQSAFVFQMLAEPKERPQLAEFLKLSDPEEAPVGAAVTR